MRQATEMDYRRRIERVADVIRADPAAPHTLAALAAVAAFSPFHFHRIYRAIKGESVAQNVRHSRLAKGALLLASSSRDVGSIAFEVGYESAEAFARAFRQFTSLSPTEFRSSRKTLADLIPGKQHQPEAKEIAMDVSIIEQPSRRVHALLNAPEETIPETYRRLWEWQIARGLAGKAEFALGICYGDPEGEDLLRYYAGVSYSAPTPTFGEVELHDIPGGCYGCHRLVGSYADIARKFHEIYGSWLPTSGFDPDDRPALEIYRNNPYSTPANALVTDLLIPLRRGN